MMGLPGAGKTTVAKVIEEMAGAIRLTSDEARVMIWDSPEFTEGEHQQLYEYLDDQTMHLLKAGKSVIYDANLNRLEHRQEKYQLAQKLGVEVKLVWVRTPLGVAKNRRIEDVHHHHLVTKNEDPESMFERIASVIEEPQADEPCIELDGTKITPTYVRDKLLAFRD